MKRIKREIKGSNRNLIILSIFVLIVSFLVGYNIQFNKQEAVSGESISDVSGYAVAGEETYYISSISGSRQSVVFNSADGYVTPGTNTELWFSLPVKPGDVITEIGVHGPVGTAGTQYKKATLYEKHPGWSGVTDLGISVQQNQGQLDQTKTISYTVKTGQMVVVKVNLYSSTDNLNNKFTGISYKVQPASLLAEETRFIAAVGAGSQWKIITTGQTYAYIIPYTNNQVGELWFSLPVKKGDIITEIGISGPIPTTGTHYKRATLIEKHPGQSAGVEKGVVQQNQGNYYIVWNNIADYTVPDSKGVLVRADLFSSAYYASNTFTGIWYKVKPASESGQLHFISPMASGSKDTYSVTFNGVTTQFGNGYAYASPTIANVVGTMWIQLPVKAGDIVTHLYVSGLMSGSGTAYTKATFYEQDLATSILTEKASVQQNLGDYYIIKSDIPDYAVPSGKNALVKVELYAGTGTSNSFTGLWWKLPLTPPSIEWQKTFGEQIARGNSVQQTSDGGYIIGGTQSSGYDDVSLIKTDGKGNTMWSKSFAGPAVDVGYDAKQTSDGGYILVGTTTSLGLGLNDVYLIKTDELGNKVWEKTFGGAKDDYGESVQQTSDGGYIISGTTYSIPEYSDVYVIKVSKNGDLEWQKTFGGNNFDGGNTVQQTSDGGYIVIGNTYSYGQGGPDIYLIKIDQNGNINWEKTFGGAKADYGESVQQTSDGGYILVGQTYSIIGASDEYHTYLIKTDSQGSQEWAKTFKGPSYTSKGYSVWQTTDGGYIVIGGVAQPGFMDGVYLLKTDKSGNKEWETKAGGIAAGYSGQQTSDGGYIAVGEKTGEVYLVKFK